MITETEIQHHFLDRFHETHGEAPEGFGKAFHKRLGNDITISMLEDASETLIRTRNTKSFPSFQVCLDAINGIRDRPKNATFLGQRGKMTSDADKLDPRWSEEAALNFCRNHTGRAAARDGWIGALVDFVRVKQHMPDETEVRELIAAHKRFEDAIVATMGNGFVSHWRGLGEAMMQRNANYAEALDRRSPTYQEQAA